MKSAPQCVRADVLGDPGAPGEPADDPGGDQEAAEFVAVQRGGVRLVVQPGTTDVRRG